MQPSDAAPVRSALRLGWALAEVRGRNRPDPVTGTALADNPNTPDHLPSRVGHALPLNIERTWRERELEAEAIMQHLAGELGVDRRPRLPDCDFDSPVRFSVQVRQMARILADQRSRQDPAADDTWDELASLIFRWDAAIQDDLAACSAAQANAYQLGRGLSESYWALSPSAASGLAGSWELLLGDGRCAYLSRLLGRLSQYFNPITAPAIAGSLRVWAKVAQDKAWRQEDPAAAITCLREQIRRWYELLIAEQNPDTLVAPYALLKDYKTSLRVAAQFAPQLLTALVSIGLLVGAGVVLSMGKGNAAVTSLVTFIGIFGLSTAALQTLIKNRTQALITRFHNNAYTDLVAVELTFIPPLPNNKTVDGAPQRTAEQFVRDTARQRQLSAAVSPTR